MCFGCLTFIGLLSHPCKMGNCSDFDVVNHSLLPHWVLGTLLIFWKLDACQLHRLVWVIPTGLLLKHQICQGCPNLLLGSLQVLIDKMVEFHAFVFRERFLGPFPHFRSVLACVQLNTLGQRCSPWNPFHGGHSEVHCLDPGLGRKDACSVCVVSSLLIWESKVFWRGGSFWCLDFKMLSHGQLVWNRGFVRHISQ